MLITETDLEYRLNLWKQGYWEVPENLDTSNFDFNWRPYKYDRPYIHQFGTQWQKTGGPKFIIPNSEGIKYQDFQCAIKLSEEDNRSWKPLLPNATIDFSWHPDETEPPFIYVFGNQWYDAEIMPTYQYRVKGATEKKYIHNVKAKLLPNRNQWSIPKNIDDSEFDYSWVPNPHEPSFNWVFGTQWQKTGGPIFKCKDPIGVKFVDFQKVKKIADEKNRAWRTLKPNIEFDYSWLPDETENPYIYVFGNQWYGPEIMPTVMYVAKGATEKRYVFDIKAKLLPDMSKWVVPDLVDDSDFDYGWIPHPYEPPMDWQFGTQWQKTGGPIYKSENSIGIKYSDIQKVVKLPNNDAREWRQLVPHVEFDTSWHPDETEPPFIYIFGNQWHTSKEMPTVQYRVKNAKILKYMDTQVAQLNVDVVSYSDSIFDAFMESSTVTDYIQIGEDKIDHTVFMPKPDEHIHIIDGITALIPKQAKTYVYNKLQDYPKIVYHSTGKIHKPLDIVFLSNGEKGAEENYEHLLHLAKDLPNSVIGLKDIKGRVASQHAAAKEASTPWYFLINGKCKVDPSFDFSWQPDRLCTARHYIFRATNPVNGLEYGHMAIVANNKRLTLNTLGKGLDFTLDSPHSVINVNSGIGLFNTSEWDTWRTAFREVIKLQHNVETLHDKESKERLNIWTTIGQGNFAEWSIQGAKDAVNYYEEANGDFEKLKLSYDWEWLRNKFDSYRP